MTGSRPRALVFLPYGNWGVNFATSLEIAQRHLDGEWDVTLLRCDGGLSACDVKHAGALPLACFTCRSAQRRAPSLLDGAVDVAVLPDADRRVDEALAALARRIDSVEQLCDLRLENFEIGEAVYSSLASSWWLDTVAPDFADPIVAGAVQDQLRACLSVYFGVRDLLLERGIRAAAAFNGRIAIMRAFIRACESAGVPYVTHERGGDRSRFLRVDGGMRHELRFITADIRRACERVPEAERERVAAEFFSDRRRGTVHSWRSHTSRQESGRVPAVDGRVAAVFTSTDTEFVGLGDEWRNHLYGSQRDGIDRIAASIVERGWSGSLVVRIHPNTTSPSAIARFAELAHRHPRVTVIRPRDPIDSYALLDDAAVVVSFGSTIGVEAAYWGKPVVLAGPAAYAGLGCVYEPRTHDELVDLVVDDATRPLPRTGAVDFGYWTRTLGEPFTYAEEPVLGYARFRGRSVDPPLLRLMRRGRDGARRVTGIRGR